MDATLILLSVFGIFIPALMLPGRTLSASSAPP